MSEEILCDKFRCAIKSELKQKSFKGQVQSL